VTFDVAALTERGGLWPLRVLWVGLPLVTGLALGDPLAGLRWPLVVEGVLWVAWFAGLLATLAPAPAGLTMVRVLAPASIAAPLVAAALSGEWSATVVTAVGYGVILTVVTLLPVVGDTMINGSAYGSERRMALRPPGYALLGPIEMAWLLVFAGVAVPTVAAADGRWLVAVPAGVVGIGACWLGWRVLHQLSRRWLVFVPAGFVIHDPLLLVESILARRSAVASLGPAVASELDRATDLSGNAAGLTLEVVLTEPASFARRIRNQAVATEADRILFTPTLPGAALREARIRAIRIDAPTG
jgi:hypothetical protein